MGLKDYRAYKLLFVICLAIPIYLGATKSEPSFKETNLKKDISAVKGIIDENHLKIRGVSGEMAHFEYQIVAAQKIVDIIDNREKISDYELSKLKTQLSILEKERNRALKQYKVILLEEYKNRDFKNKLLFLASSSNLSDFVNRLNHLNKLKNYRKKQLLAIEKKRSEAQDKVAVYNGTYNDKAKISKSKREELRKLNELLNQKHSILSKLKADDSVLALRLKERQNQLNQLNNVISTAISSTKLNSTKTKRAFSRKLSWPVKSGLLVSKFGKHKHAKQRKVQVENNGIDILVSKNISVKSIYDGVVKAILQLPGSNTSVIIDHGEFYSVYSNLVSVNLKIGDKVAKGTTLTTKVQDSEGLQKLHFELWQGTKKLNPEFHLSGKLQ